MSDAPTSDLPTPEVVLVVVAHPDDAEFEAGATLAKWARAGTTVHHLVLTDGSKGTWDADADVAALVARRQDEQRAARDALGVTGEAIFLGEVDGELGTGADLRRRVAEVIRRLRPTVVIGHDPWKRYRLHPDHRAAGVLCVDGIVAARDPFFHPELLEAGLEPHRPEALLLFEADEVNHLETVGEDDVAAKLRALEAHESQIETTHLYRVQGVEPESGDPLDAFRARERQRLLDAAAAAGHEGMVEAFHLERDQL